MRAYVIENGNIGVIRLRMRQTIRIRQPVPSPEVQRVALEAGSIGNERQRILMKALPSVPARGRFPTPVKRHRH